jgi:hypothetical protein
MFPSNFLDIMPLLTIIEALSGAACLEGALAEPIHSLIIREVII